MDGLCTNGKRAYTAKTIKKMAKDRGHHQTVGDELVNELINPP